MRWPWRSAQDQPQGETKRVRELREQIAEATRLRGLVRNPDLHAVEIEKHRKRTLLGLWFFLALGLTFTTAGVQDFLAGEATPSDPVWWVAWTVEPMFAGLLIVLLNFEALILSYGINPDHQWWTRLKRVLLASTLFMNVVPQLVPLATDWRRFNPASAAVHAIIPVIVYGLAEVIPVIQARARQAIVDGYDQADQAEAPVPAQSRVEEEPRETPSPARAEQDDPKTVIQRGPKLPAQMQTAIEQARTQAVAAGRELTVLDVQAVVRVPDEMAQQIVASYTTNGHPIT